MQSFKALYQRDRFFRLFLCHRKYLRKPFAVTGEPHRHNSDGSALGAQSVKVIKRLSQHFPIIYFGAKNNLAIKAQSLSMQPCQPFKDVFGIFAAHHALSYFTVGRMNGDIERRNAPFNDPFKFLFADICKRYIVAHYQRKPPVVILEIQGFSVAVGHLIYKTEDAVIGALAHRTHQ